MDEVDAEFLAKFQRGSRRLGRTVYVWFTKTGPKSTINLSVVPLDVDYLEVTPDTHKWVKG